MTTFDYTTADVALDDKIDAAEKKLAMLYAKRANKHKTHDWYWCASGRHGVTRDVGTHVYDRCGCVTCPHCRAANAASTRDQPHVPYSVVEDRVAHAAWASCFACDKSFAFTATGVQAEACATCGKPAQTRNLAEGRYTEPACYEHMHS